MPVVYSRKRLRALEHAPTSLTTQKDQSIATLVCETSHSQSPRPLAPHPQSPQPQPSRYPKPPQLSSSPHPQPRQPQILQSSSPQLTPAKLDSSNLTPLKLNSSKLDPPKSISSTPKRRKRNFVQTYIDVGQHDLTSRQCRQCQMVYAPGAPDDDALHQRYHAKFLSRNNKRPHFPGWIGERVLLSSIHSGRFVAVKACDSLSWRRRIYQIDAFVSRQLTSISSLLSLHPSQSAWLAILFVVDQAVQAYALADLVSSARPACVSHDGIATISTAAKPKCGTICGIRKIWVAHDWQRKGIATQLVDAARINLLYGHVIPHHLLAFTPTTSAGALFARAYVRSSCAAVLIYTLPSTKPSSTFKV